MNGHAHGDASPTKASVVGDRHKKPPSCAVELTAIPDGLKSFDRAIGWRWKWDGKAKQGKGHWTKPPVNVRTGGPGSSTDSATWCALETAIDAQRKGFVDGAGFVLGADDCGIHFAGIDLDDCRNPDTEELSDIAQDIIAMMDTYCEVSPTGTGVKLLCIGSLPDGAKTKNKAGTVELYASGRYFTLTGNRIEGTPKRVEERHEQLNAVWRKYIGSQQPRRMSAQNGHTQNHAHNGHDSGADQRALESMLRIPAKAGESDSSNRLLAVCCRAVEHDLSDESALATIRDYERQIPFAANWSDSDIVRRLRDAEQKAERGKALQSPIRHATDVGNAERFAEQHGADVRYCHQWNKWFVWDGRRWAMDITGEVMRRAKATARSIYAEVSKVSDDDQREALAKWAAASERRERLTAMIALAQSEQPIPIAVGALDAEPWLLNCENGTIELQTGELREHRREDYLTKLCAIEYPTEAGDDPDLWLSFLNRIFSDNAKLIGFFQRLLGVALVGEVIEHMLPIFFGIGANGKSVALETVCGMLGPDYAMNAPPGLLMATKSDRHPTELADLHGKRFVAAIETADGGRLSEALVKELTGGDSIRARRMREDFWQFRPSHTVVLATNHKPAIRGTDHGIWRRIKLVPFVVTIPDAEQDKQLTQKLRREWPAIMRWAVAGCLDWQHNGLQPPDEVNDATSSYRHDMDVLGEFIEGCCVTGDDCEARASDLYQRYRRWAEARGEFVETQTKFGGRLTERGFDKQRDSSTGRIVYRRIGLLPEGSE